MFNTEVEKPSETVVDPPPSTSTPLPGVDVGVKLPGSGKGSQVSDPPFVVGEGLAPVPAKLVTKILRGEYVDMSELLRDNTEAERRQMGRVTRHPQLGAVLRYLCKRRDQQVPGTEPPAPRVSHHNG